LDGFQKIPWPGGTERTRGIDREEKTRRPGVVPNDAKKDQTGIITQNVKKRIAIKKMEGIAPKQQRGQLGTKEDKHLKALRGERLIQAIGEDDLANLSRKEKLWA